MKKEFQDRRTERGIHMSERRTEVAEAAWRVISRDGLEKASLRRIAIEMGCTTGVLSHYFEDKDDLLRFTLERISQALMQDGLSHPDAGTTLENYQALLLEILPSTRNKNTDHWRVWIEFIAAALHRSDLRDLHSKAYDSFRAGTVSYIEKLKDVGAIPVTTDVEVKADVIICFMDGLGLHSTLDPEDWNAQRQIQSLADFISNLFKE